VYLTYAIAAVPEYSNDIIDGPYCGDTAINEERHGWPDIQGLLCRSAGVYYSKVSDSDDV